jgi:hypothetical protein
MNGSCFSPTKVDGTIDFNIAASPVVPPKDAGENDS